MVEVDVAIVGAGPAGLSAANELIDWGATVALVDDCILPGGQYFRQLSSGFRRTGVSPMDEGYDRLQKLTKILGHKHIKYIPNAVVWNVSDMELAYACGKFSGRLRARFIIVAAGAHDRPVAFPGWTLPGVHTAGGVLNLVKSQRVTPGQRIFVTGNGPLILAATYALLSVDSKVIGVSETASLSQIWRLWKGLVTNPSLLLKGLKYRLRMMASGVRFYGGHVIVEALGDQCVEGVSIAPIDNQGRVDVSKKKRFDVDTLVMGYGLTPSIELTRLLGCHHMYLPLRGGWIPVRTKHLETTRHNIFAVGDGAGIGGAELAVTEGRIAAFEIIGRMNESKMPELNTVLDRARRRLQSLERFRSGMELAFTPPKSYLELLTPDTIVCRCENLTCEQLMATLRSENISVDEVKIATRITMGRCQGRNCIRTYLDLASREPEKDISEICLPTARPPARPVRIDDLTDEPLSPPIPPEML